MPQPELEQQRKYQKWLKRAKSEDFSKIDKLNLVYPAGMVFLAVIEHIP